MSSKISTGKQTGLGKIYFIGSGPGNPELITIKGAAILSQAEVIIADRLAGDEIIQRYANANAVIIDVGKQGGNAKSYKQKDINNLLVQFARLYSTVVRLKGGDIAFFSNIYDELQTANENNIAYEIIPGITAASGASAYTGVPLTAKNFASSVHFLTYYNNTVIDDNTWKRYAEFNSTLVFYMSSSNLISIVQKLIEAGADAKIPFIVVEQATTPNQHVYSFTLQSFLNDSKQNFVSPSIVIMGKVAALYKNFSWFDNEQTSSSYFRNADIENDYMKIKSFILQKNNEHVN